MRTSSPAMPAGDLDEFLDWLMLTIGSRDDLPDENTPQGRIARDFFENNWTTGRDGLLARMREQVGPVDYGSP